MIMKSLAIAGLALSLASGAALAGPKGCPPGHAKKGECGQVEKHDHDRGRHHQWKRGQRVEPSRYVVIERYRDHGYQPPPRGHRYVRVDGDVLLIAIASGVIADIILNN